MAATRRTSLYLEFVAFYFLVGNTRYCNANQCSVSLPQKIPEDSPCSAARNAELAKTKHLYNLKSSEPSHPFLLSHKSPNELMEFIKKDPFIRYYALGYRGMAEVNKHLRETYIAKHASDPEVENATEYKALGQFFKQTGQMMIGEYGRMISDYEPFMLDMKTWIEDKYFTEQRLAGGNPMSLRLVSQDVGLNWEKLKEELNPNFNWEQAVQEVVGAEIPMEEALQEKRLFALRYEECDGMKATNDIMESDIRRTMWRTLSPIALFASVPGEPVELKPVAIQMDYTPDSAVFTPKDGGLWMLAKLNVQATDAAYLEIVEHLAKTHFFIEPLCIIMWRTLPSKHPLNQMMKYHCRGITIPSTFGGPKTINPEWFMHRLFGCGWEGAIHMMREVHPKLSWDITDFRKNIKDRGLDDKSKIPYFPYRDDGEAILKSIETLVDSYVNLYYKTNGDVRKDVELQAFANEVSFDGNTGPTGGLGKVKGFPAKMKTINQLKNFLSRFIWHVSPQHAAVDFVLPEYALYTPNVPTRLYNDTRVQPGTFSILNLPNRNIAAWATNLMMNVGRFRWDLLFDYGNKLEDASARQILYKHHHNILTKLQPELEAINKDRKASNHLTYPFFLPRWLPNAIQV